MYSGETLMPKYVVKSIKQTCYACPAQWEGLTTNFEPIYVRERWDHLSIRIGKIGKGIESAVNGKPILEMNVDGFGSFQYEQLKQIAPDLIQFPEQMDNNPDEWFINQ
jgi:hypothetical protein